MSLNPSLLRRQYFELSEGPGWFDAHSHLADPRWTDLEPVLARARSRGIQFHLQGGVGPEDWERQRELSQKHPEIWPVYGLHPYWIAAHTEAEGEQALDQLARLIPSSLALGETGLDFRSAIANGSEMRQIHFFEAQLEMARVADRPVILHVVRAFEECLRVLDLFGTQSRGIVHAFSGSLPQAEAFLERGFLISVGGRLCRPDATRLHQAVRGLSLDHLVIETDSPDQPPPGFDSNEPQTLELVAAQVAELHQTTAARVLDKSRENLRKLLLPEFFPGDSHVHA